MISLIILIITYFERGGPEPLTHGPRAVDITSHNTYDVTSNQHNIHYAIVPSALVTADFRNSIVFFWAETLAH